MGRPCLLRGGYLAQDRAREWTSCGDRLLPDNILEVRYETLVRTPEAVLTDVCRFLGKDFAPGTMEYADTSTYDRPDPKLTEQWRHKLNATALGLVEQRAGDLLEQRGFAPSGYPKMSPTILQRIALWTVNKRGIWAWRVRRHGWRDPNTVLARTPPEAPVPSGGRLT